MDETAVHLEEQRFSLDQCHFFFDKTAGLFYFGWLWRSASKTF
jgi:hypothetical protein